MGSAECWLSSCLRAVYPLKPKDTIRTLRRVLDHQSTLDERARGMLSLARIYQLRAYAPERCRKQNRPWTQLAAIEVGQELKGNHDVG
jgi:hypothetical protein